MAKYYYNHKHQSMNFKVKDYVQIVLHKEYLLNTLSIRFKKLDIQSTGPFKIIEKIR